MIAVRNAKKYKFINIWMISIILLISILLNIVLYKGMMNYYELLYAAELDPLGLDHFQNQPIQQLGNDPIVVFFGDSRAAQWTNPHLDDFTFINRGIGNQTSAQVAGRFEAHIKPLRPNIVIIQVGINDLKTIPLFPERKQEIISDYESNIRTIIQDSQGINATVILTTIFPAGRNVPFTRRLVWSDDIYKAIKEVNEFILGLADERVIVFDAANLLADPDGKIQPGYSSDLLHLNTEGYDVLNQELVKILTRIK